MCTYPRREEGLRWISESLNYYSGPNEIPHLPKSVIHLGWGIQQKEGRNEERCYRRKFSFG